jgi:RNA polymerase sigma factor (sigma-70 family)
MKDDTYRKHQKLIYKEAHRINRLHPELEFDEIVSECNLVFAKCLEAHDPARGKLSTMFVSIARREIARTLFHNNKPFSLPGEIDMGAEESQAISFWEKFQSMSNEAQEVALTVLKAPDELGGFTKKQIYEFFRGQGWQYKVLDLTWQEISEAVS